MKKICLFIAFVLTLTSCSKDLPNDELYGEWHLVEVSNSLVFEDFEVGKHIWNFDVDNNQVTVTNNQEDYLQTLDSGTYDIEVTETHITLESIPYTYGFTDERLFLEFQSNSDGPLLYFVRE